ncbi:MAG: 8-amino-7-oxononanoate synthase [Sterolibacterium sp.]|nr:8-amino-7-oxononanoate synthase [Sterolibacterium sp.]
MSAWRDRYLADASDWRSAGLERRRRVVRPVTSTQVEADGKLVTAFASNDYLGLSRHPSLIEAIAEGARHFGAGAGASHLISGHHEVHEVLEHEIARFAGKPAALHFMNGYVANLALMTALAGKGDVIYSDAFNHASIVDGARLSQAEINIYPHADVQALETLLKASAARQKLVVTDAVFSMDGDVAPLRELLALCEQYDALLIVDDAHGLGVWGPEGRGSLQALGLQSERIVYMGTLGKSAGLSGAFVAAEELIIDRLIQRARPYVFSTAGSPALAHATLTALDLIRSADAARGRLVIYRERLQSASSGWRPYRLLTSSTPIQPLVIGENTATVRIADALLQEGLWVPAIRPPTVPKGSARLRITLSAAHTLEDIERLVGALSRVILV